MRVYKHATIITGMLTILSFLSSLYLNFCTSKGNIDVFWCNALLGVFGSSLLTFISSIIGYRVERRKTFENFSYATKELLHELNKYQSSWNTKEKIKFFLHYNDISKVDWDRQYGEFCFLLDFCHKCRNYIYYRIYTPIQEINSVIGSHMWHFRFQQENSEPVPPAVEDFVKEIEQLIMEVKTVTQIPVSKNKIVTTISYELNNTYFRYMYGIFQYKKSLKEE